MEGALVSNTLQPFVERIESLEVERKKVADLIREVYAEAKGSGFDTKILRKVVAERRKDEDQRAEEWALLDLYMEQLA